MSQEQTTPQATLSREPHACRIPFQLLSDAPSFDKSDPHAPFRNILDVKRDLVRSALNRKIQHKIPRKPLPQTRSQIINEALKCINNEVPLPSSSMVVPGYRLPVENTNHYGSWKQNQSMACLNRTLQEYREQELTADEQRVATPYEIRLARDRNQIFRMQVLWKTRLYNMRAAAAQQQQSTSVYSFNPPVPTVSVFEEDTEDEGENNFVESCDDEDVDFDGSDKMIHDLLEDLTGDISEASLDSEFNKGTPSSAPARSGSLFSYAEMQQRTAKNIARLQQLVDEAPAPTPGEPSPSNTQPGPVNAFGILLPKQLQNNFNASQRRNSQNLSNHPLDTSMSNAPQEEYDLNQTY
ncbi:hypothetical protein SEUCBS140593_004169 [Sporothrix eucalyptigena]|uniref:Uncharacterized protein n=1 Tax=Sporothrix eucalyptigena TaxID=1812306 RepID=A0ABP0BKS6_9PEZI